MFLVKVTEFKKLVENEKVKCGDAAASPHLTFSFSTSFFKFNDFNKEHTSFLKMI